MVINKEFNEILREFTEEPVILKVNINDINVDLYKNQQLNYTYNLNEFIFNLTANADLTKSMYNHILGRYPYLDYYTINNLIRESFINNKGFSYSFHYKNIPLNKTKEFVLFKEYLIRYNENKVMPFFLIDKYYLDFFFYNYPKIDFLNISNYFKKHFDYLQNNNQNQDNLVTYNNLLNKVILKLKDIEKDDDFVNMFFTENEKSAEEIKKTNISSKDIKKFIKEKSNLQLKELENLKFSI